MQRKFLPKLGIALLTLAVIGVGIFSIQAIVRARQNQHSVTTTSQSVPLVAHARLLGAASGQQQLDLSVGLHLHNEQELSNILSNLYNPRSPQYHHFLTSQQFTAKFSPTPQEQQQVVDYLHSQGFTVTHVAPNGLLIDASGTVTQAERAFQVSINNYQSGNNRFFANASAPTIPSSLASLIVSIGGLDNSVRLHPLLSHKKLGISKASLSHAVPAAPSGFGPTELAGAYDANLLHQAGIQGNNQTVAVFELDGYQSSDITQYLQNYQLGSPSISNVLVDSFNGSAGAGAIEVELDIEVVAAMAPKANQIVYEGPNTTQGVNDTYNQIVTDNKAQIATISWGECESQSGNSELQTLDNILKQGSAEGIAMYAASGDSGAYDCNDSNLAVDSPAGDPNITGVGGTNLQLSNGAYGSESVWSNASDTQRSPKGSGGGGGISSFFTQPSWQTGPGVKNQYSTGNREVPDVSANADPATGYAVYCTVSASGCQSSGWITVGGTSAAAPMWAGSTALINEYLQKQGKSRIGFANPVLYSLASTQQPYSAFHDVSSGTNLYYPATSNYDEASGLGSPDIYNIARDIAAGSGAPPPTPTPGPPGTPTPTPTSPPAPSPTATNTPVPPPTDTPVPPGPTDTPTPPPGPTDTPVPPPPPPSGSLIQNGDFEQGTTPWQESSSNGYELIDPTNPHSGQYSVFLCGYSNCNDSIGQDFTVPSSATNISVSYWWYGNTTHITHSCKDKLTATLLDSNGNVIATLQKACNTDANDTWQQVTFDASNALANYAGQMVTLVFQGTTSSSSATSSFFVDDVAVSAS